MKGFLHVDITEKEDGYNLKTDCSISHASHLDRIVVLRSICKALDFDIEPRQLLDLMASELIDSMFSTFPTGDNSKEKDLSHLIEQMKDYIKKREDKGE